MPAARTVACPACGAPREGVKANPGVALICRTCGHKFLCPPADPTPEPAGVDEPAPAADPGGVTVSRGRPKIPQTARPRARATDPPPPPDPEPAPQPPPAPGPGRDGKTGDIDTLSKAGRRGGLARYARSKTRG